jgi:hypothetical protein
LKLIVNYLQILEQQAAQGILGVGGNKFSSSNGNLPATLSTIPLSQSSNLNINQSMNNNSSEVGNTNVTSSVTSNSNSSMLNVSSGIDKQNGSIPQLQAQNQQVSNVQGQQGQQGQIISMKREGERENFVDITEYLNLPQTEAAKRLGIPTSTLSKRWKEAVVNRKWPFRTVAKLDKEIMTLLHNIPQGPDAPPLPAEIEASLGILLRKRQEELRPVVIRL